MNIVDDLPPNPAEGEVVWIMFGGGVGNQYTFEKGTWHLTAAMNCPYIPIEFQDVENHPFTNMMERDN